MRRIATELRPSALDQLGLFDALEWQLVEFQARTDVTCTHSIDADDVTIDMPRSTDVFRVFQEALTNVARHANATRIHLTVTRGAGLLILELRDNGCGIQERSLADGTSLGIIGMRERIACWGGTVHVTGVPGEGTTVRIELPLAEERDDP
jgi:signal transduction histidine kinase